MKEKIEKINQDDYNDWSNKIKNKLHSLHDWKQAHMIGITISRGKEVYTRSIIEKGWEEGKKIVVPKCNPAQKEMTFRIIDAFDQLENIYYNLEEPKEAITEPVSANEIDLLIVPGLAFDVKGYRLGFGGGYYDRFLKTYKGNTAALAFQLQVVSEIPTEIHDMPVHKIITNNQVILC